VPCAHACRHGFAWPPTDEHAPVHEAEAGEQDAGVGARHPGVLRREAGGVGGRARVGEHKCMHATGRTSLVLVPLAPTPVPSSPSPPPHRVHNVPAPGRRALVAGAADVEVTIRQRGLYEVHNIGIRLGHGACCLGWGRLAQLGN